MAAKSVSVVNCDRSAVVFSQPLELKVLLTPVMKAALLAKQNVLLISKPGYGKSEILAAMGQQVYGAHVDPNGIDRSFVLPCTPTTMPHDVVGYSNPAYAIDRDAEAAGLPEWITKGTPVDEQYELCILEETTRIGDHGGDALIHAMHNVSKYHRPVYVGNANWLTATQRNEALRDRFAFTVFYQPSVVDIDELGKTPAIETWQFDLPTAQEIETVRQWTSEFTYNPEAFKCLKVINSPLKKIQRLCEGTAFEFNNRRYFQFRSMLYALGAYYAGTPDFDELPREAFDALAYAYPVTDYAESNLWRKIVMAVVDAVETEIAEFRANAYAAWRNLWAQHADQRSGTLPTANLDKFKREIGTLWKNYEKELTGQYPNDPRVAQVLGEMFSVYREMIQGKNPLKTG